MDSQSDKDKQFHYDEDVSSSFLTTSPIPLMEQAKQEEKEATKLDKEDADHRDTRREPDSQRR